MHEMIEQRCMAYQSFHFQLMRRALSVTMYHLTEQKAPVSPALLVQLCKLTDHMGHLGPLFKCLFTLAFFRFLRVSNLVPPSGRVFDKTRQLCRGDIIVQSDSLLGLIKWSRTKQIHDKLQCIAVTALPGHIVCPVQAFRDFNRKFPAANNAPLFSYTSHKQCVVLSSSKIQKTLKMLLDLLGYTPSHFSMHSFRRGGCTTAFNCLASPVQIKEHGLWVSDAYQRYISTDIDGKLAVTQLMSQAFK